MTTSKWDLLDQQEEEDSNAKEEDTEDIDGA